MKWVLIIMMASATDGGVAVQKIDGFSSEKTCLEATNKVPKAVWEHSFGAGYTKSFCIEVK